MSNYEQVATEARLRTLDLIYKAQTSHIGSNFSAIDIMAILFDKADPQKDEVILSAGWKAASWYYFLWKKGIITEEELNSFCQEGSPFIGLIEPMDRWGLRFAGGSMGYGLPFGVGVALAKKLRGEEGTVYVLMSDGELAIGTTWEVALIAAHHKLNNLVVIVDYNGFQAMGRVGGILKVGNRRWDGEEKTDGFSLATALNSLGWSVKRVDGHNFFRLEDIGDIEYKVGNPLVEHTPTFVIAHTAKGKGVSFMENNNLYHYKALSQDEYEGAKRELNG